MKKSKLIVFLLFLIVINLKDVLAENATVKITLKDDTGKYHYDWNTLSTNPVGIYFIIYTATDGTRIAIEKDRVELK